MTSIQQSDLAEAIQAAAMEVLETMFFTSVLDESEGAPDAPPVLASLDFHGTPSGSFQVELARPAAVCLAADFLGTDAEEICDERAQEVTCELANMLCGSILSRIEPDALFDLSHPEPLVRLSEGAGVSQVLFLTGGNLRASIRLEDVP
jgi:CheY-specific phosphatase CheX